MRVSLTWTAALCFSHIVRDWLPAPAVPVPLGVEVEELRIQVESTRRLFEHHNDAVRQSENRLFWQGLLLRVSLLVDLGLGALTLWLWLGRTVSREILGQASTRPRKSRSPERSCQMVFDKEVEDESVGQSGPTRPSDFK